MATLTLRPDLVTKLEQIAQNENRTVEQVVETLVTTYVSATKADLESPETKFQKMLDMIDSDETVVWQDNRDLSERAKEILDSEYAEYLSSHNESDPR